MYICCPERGFRMFEICSRKWMQMDDDTCKYAAQKRHIECLKYARENGCEESRKKYI
jgi:hypothetical protein